MIPREVIVLAAAWRDWSEEESFPFDTSHCINGTRVVIRVLEQLGIKAKPLSVDYLLLNEPARQLLEAGIPADQWPEHAWSIGRGPGLDDDPRPGRWNGHLIAEGDGWLLDISAQQFDRPGRLTVPAPFVLEGTLPPVGERLSFTGNGQTLLLGRWPENNEWRSQPGWKRAHAEQVVELLRRMRNLVSTVPR